MIRLYGIFKVLGSSLQTSTNTLKFRLYAVGFLVVYFPMIISCIIASCFPDWLVHEPFVLDTGEVFYRCYNRSDIIIVLFSLMGIYQGILLIIICYQLKGIRAAFNEFHHTKLGLVLSSIGGILVIIFWKAAPVEDTWGRLMTLFSDLFLTSCYFWSITWQVVYSRLKNPEEQLRLFSSSLVMTELPMLMDPPPSPSPLTPKSSSSSLFKSSPSSATLKIKYIPEEERELPLINIDTAMSITSNSNSTSTSNNNSSNNSNDSSDSKSFTNSQNNISNGSDSNNSNDNLRPSNHNASATLDVTTNNNNSNNNTTTKNRVSFFNPQSNNETKMETSQS